MNKKTFFLLVTLGVVSVLFSVRFYYINKQEALKEYKSFLAFEKKVKKILYLKNTFSDIRRLKRLNYCKTKDYSQKLVLICNNLDNKKFIKIQNILFRGNYIINKFSITDKNNKLFLKAEINK